MSLRDSLKHILCLESSRYGFSNHQSIFNQSHSLSIWTSGRLNVWTSRCPDVRTFGGPDIWVQSSKRPDSLESRSVDVTCGPDIRTSGRLDVKTKPRPNENRVLEEVILIKYISNFRFRLFIWCFLFGFGINKGIE